MGWGKPRWGPFPSEEITSHCFLKAKVIQQNLWNRHGFCFSGRQRGLAERRMPDVHNEEGRCSFLFAGYVWRVPPLLRTARREKGTTSWRFVISNSLGVEIHNWVGLSLSPQGAVALHGKKVERLPYPLFPFGTTDLRKLKAKIVDELDSKQCQDGEMAPTFLRSLQLPEQ